MCEVCKRISESKTGTIISELTQRDRLALLPCIVQGLTVGAVHSTTSRIQTAKVGRNLVRVYVANAIVRKVHWAADTSALCKTASSPNNLTIVASEVTCKRCLLQLKSSVTSAPVLGPCFNCGEVPRVDVTTDHSVVPTYKFKLRHDNSDCLYKHILYHRDVTTLVSIWNALQKEQQEDREQENP